MNRRTAATAAVVLTLGPTGGLATATSTIIVTPDDRHHTTPQIKTVDSDLPFCTEQPTQKGTPTITVRVS